MSRLLLSQDILGRFLHPYEVPGAEPGAGDDVMNEVHRTPSFMAPHPEGQQTLNLVIYEGDEF